jgi:hypothetical protein
MLRLPSGIIDMDWMAPFEVDVVEMFYKPILTPDLTAFSLRLAP